MLRPKRLSQAAIAKATGVSRATVSLILRGGVGASATTQAKVLAAAEKMGYRPNALVHSIRSGKSRTVGVLVQPHNSYWRDICYGIHDRLIESDHLPLFLWDTHHEETVDEEYALKQIYRLLDRWVDGVILWPYFASLYARHLNEFQRRNIPLVTIHHSIPNFPSDIVESDEAQIASLLSTHLRDLGHREILVVAGPEDVAWANERYVALQTELRRTPGTVAHELRLPVASRSLEQSAAGILEVLRAKPQITAVIGSTDDFARGAYVAAQALGWSIPGRLSVVGIADLEAATTLIPGLTTVRQDGYALGRQAAQVELERSAGVISGPPRHFRAPVTLVTRGSTARVFAET
ncbi:MAG: LacI family DNA-binding transcriptional regulator [Verrucomicrobiota bacterium]